MDKSSNVLIFSGRADCLLSCNDHPSNGDPPLPHHQIVIWICNSFSICQDNTFVHSSDHTYVQIHQTISVQVPLLILIGQLGNSLSVYQAAEQDLVV